MRLSLVVCPLRTGQRGVRAHGRVRRRMVTLGAKVMAKIARDSTRRVVGKTSCLVDGPGEH
jgi:hypothetical protein